MIGSIRKHQQWLWVVIIAATIISFVKYLNPSSRYARGGGDDSAPAIDLGTVFGEPIALKDMQEAVAEAKIQFRVHTGEWATSENDRKQVQNVANEFVLIQAELKRHNIQTTAVAAARWTKNFFGAPLDAPLPADKLDQYLVQLLRGGDCTADDFINYANLMAGQEYLMALYGMSGTLITPSEAESFYRQENQPMQVEMVSFAGSNFVDRVQPSESDLVEFYNKRQAQYRVPEQVTVNFVPFIASNYLAAADKELGTNLEPKVEQFYSQVDPDTLRDEHHNLLSPDAARAKIRFQVRYANAQVLARRAADDLGTQLLAGHDDDHPFNADDLAKVAGALGLKVQTTAPFDLRNGPAELTVNEQQLRAILALRDDDPDDKEKAGMYLAAPLVTEQGSYIIGLKERFPSQIPPLADIHDRVRRDYIQAAALSIAREVGKVFAQSVADARPGTTFDQVCGAQAVSPLALPPFSLTTSSLPGVPDHRVFQLIQDSTYNLPTGKATSFVPTDFGGFVACVTGRLPVDETEMARLLPRYLDRMRQQRQITAYNQWLGHEAQQHLIVPRDDKPSAG